MKWKQEIKGLAAVVLLPLLFFCRELLGLSVFAGWDFSHIIMPLQQFSRESIRNGYFPHWNPYWFAGFPQHAEGEGGLFYPLNFIFQLPGDPAVLLGWVVVIHLIIAGCLMYLFLRGRGNSIASSGWIALMYQFSPGLIFRFETVGLYEAVTWLPGFYWACENAVNATVSGKQNEPESAKIAGAGGIARWLSWSLVCAMIIAFMLLAGSSQIAFYTLVGSVFYLAGVAARGPKPWTRAAFASGTFVIASGLGALLSMAQLLPTNIFATLSHRVHEIDPEFFRMGTWLTIPRLTSLFMFPAVKDASELIDYISSLGYIGLLPFLLVGITLSLHRRNMNPILPPFFLVFFGLILAFGLNFVLNRDLLSYPGFNLFRALGRMILPVQIGLFALAAIGLDALFIRDASDFIRSRTILGLRWAAMIAGGLFIWRMITEKTGYSLFDSIGLALLSISILLVGFNLVLFFRTGRIKILQWLLILWVVIHIAILVPVHSKITMERGSYNALLASLDTMREEISMDPVRPPRVLIPTDLNIWGPLIEKLMSNAFSSHEQLPTPAFGNELSLAHIGVLNAYTPLVSERWFALAHDYAARGLDEVTEASPRFRNILEITCTDVIISPEQFTGGDDFVPLAFDMENLFPGDFHIIKTPSTVPYVSVPKMAETWVWNDWEMFRQWIVREEYVPGERVCIELQPDVQLPEEMLVVDPWISKEAFVPVMPAWGFIPFPSDAEYQVVSVNRHGNEIDVHIVTDAPCWVVVRESYFPGMYAWVDDVKSNVYPADFLFCGIPVGAGEHFIKLAYTTPGISQGIKISTVSWLIWIVLIISCITVANVRKD